MKISSSASSVITTVRPSPSDGCSLCTSIVKQRTPYLLASSSYAISSSSLVARTEKLWYASTPSATVLIPGKARFRRSSTDNMSQKLSNLSTRWTNTRTLPSKIVSPGLTFLAFPMLMRPSNVFCPIAIRSSKSDLIGNLNSSLSSS